MIATALFPYLLYYLLETCNFIFLLNELNLSGFDFVKAMKKLSFREPASCSIHCWQFMKVSELFEYDIETVTLNHFFQWVKSKFSQVVHFVPGNTFKVYYLVNIESWHAKENISDTTTLREKLLLVSNDILQYIIVSIEKHSPTKAPCDDNVSSVAISEVTNNSNSSRGSVQGNFHQRVLTRDNSTCVFCSNKRTAELKAAHLFDIFRAKDIPENDPDFLHQYGITDLYDTSNGITLCSECHDVFDALLCCVEVRMSEDGSITDHIIIVANALLSSPAFQCKWTALNGAQVAVPSKRLMLKNWPPPMLLKFREDKFKERVIERHKLAEDLPNICTKCGRRCKSVGGLAAHSRSKVCLDMVINKSNKLSRLYTPAGIRFK
jgi:hypothetical protein